MEKKSKKNGIIEAFSASTQKRDNTYTSPTVMAPYKPVNTTSEFINEKPKEERPSLVNGRLVMPRKDLVVRKRNPNANPGLVNVSPEFDILTGVGGVVKSGAYKSAYKINPFAEKLKERGASFRVAGEDAYKDFIESGVVRSGDGSLSGLKFVDDAGIERQIKRPTGFPSFQKDYADFRYADESMKNYVYKTKVPTFARGEINPVTGQRISGRHYAHRPIDMKTGEVIRELPAKDVEVFEGIPHWLKGYNKIKASKTK